MEEEFDIVDSNGNVIGFAKKSKFHANNNIIHPVAHCYIFNSKNHLLLQQRSKNKEFGARLWDISAGGHIKKGETPINGANRELVEELGDINLELTYLFKYLKKYKSQTELIYIFQGKTNKSISDFNYDPIEVEGLKWFNIKKLKSMISKKQIYVTEWITDELPLVIKHMKIA